LSNSRNQKRQKIPCQQNTKWSSKAIIVTPKEKEQEEQEFQEVKVQVKRRAETE